MKNFYEELEYLEQLSGSLDKEAQLMHILTHVKNAEAFFRFTFNDIKYGVQEQTFKNAFGNVNTMTNFEHISDWLATTIFEPMRDGSSYKVPQLIDFGTKLFNNSGTSQENLISNFISQCEPLKKKWFSRAILKDLRCGVGLKTVNSVFKELGLKTIDKFALQLCAKTKNFDLYANADNVAKKVVFPCSMECKYDGIRLQAEIFDSGNESGVILTSRRGTDRTADYPEICLALVTQFAGENIILDGEIISRSFQDLTRKDSTAMKKYVVFDLLVDEQLPYINRWYNLVSLFIARGITDFMDNKNINNIDNHIVLAEHYSCNHIGEAQEYYTELNERGEEGLIIKNDRAPYERGSRKHMFKFKKVYTADLLCYAYRQGEGKRANKVGSLCLQDKSKTISVDVGAGLSDDMIDELTKQAEVLSEERNPNFIGQIVEIAYNEITETGSIRFPRFIGFRDDKTEPDDLSNSEVRQHE